MPKNDQTFTEAVEIFLKEAYWLTPEDQPEVVALQALAARLDESLVVPAAAVYGVTYRSLLKRKPRSKPALDEFEAALEAGNAAADAV